jgi:hypothetical protein
MGSWIANRLFDLNSESFELLLQHKIPGILVKEFVSKEECAAVADRLKKMQFGNYDHLKDIPVHHLGVCHNQLVNEDKSVYFGKIEEANRLVASIFDGIIDNPVNKLLDRLNQSTSRKAQIATEEGYGEYFAGAFRSFSGHGRLHVDHAPTHIKPHWDVKNIIQQLTWNIYFSMLNTGGDLVIYDTIHTPENELQKVPGEYYFPYSVLEGNAHLKVIPEIGDLIIFNTQNFHEILGNTDGRRISQTSFMGIGFDGGIRIWS